MHQENENYKRMSFSELVEACGGKKGAIISGDDAYDGNYGAEFDPYDDDDADCCCD